MKAVLGNPGLEAALAWAEADDAGDEATYEDEILKVMLSRGKQPNLSFLPSPPHLRRKPGSLWP